MTVDEFTRVVASRFAGLDLQYRRTFERVPGQPQIGSPVIHWPHAWRARLLTSKNERSEYRLTAYGDTAEEAITALAWLVSQQDAGLATSSSERLGANGVSGR